MVDDKSETPCLTRVLSRRELLAGSATAATANLAGCGGLGGGTTINQAELKLDTDRSGVLTLKLSGNADKVANTEDIVSNILVSGDIVDINAVDGKTLRITIRNLLNRELNGDYSQYSHSPIAFDTESSVSLGDDVEIRVLYPEVSIGDSDEMSYQPEYLFTGGSLSEYVTIPQLLENGDDVRYEVDRTPAYEPYEKPGSNTDWQTAYRSIDTTRWVHDYSSKAPVGWSTGNPPFNYVEGDHSPPWNYESDVDNELQIPGTTHLANHDRLLLELEALTRDYLYRQTVALLNNATASWEEIARSMRDFVKNVGSTLKTIASFSPSVLSSLNFVRKLGKIAQSADELLEQSGEKFKDIDRWTASIHTEPGRSFHTFKHLKILSDIEANELSQKVAHLDVAGGEPEAIYGQYQDNLLQQYVVGETIRQGLHEMRYVYRGVAAGDRVPEEHERLAELVFNTLEQTQASLIRSFAHLDSLPTEGAVADEGLSFSVADSGGDTAYTGERYNLTVYAENRGSETIEQDVSLYADGTRVTSSTVSVEGGSRESVDLGFFPQSEGEVQLQVQSIPVGTLSVVKAFETGGPTLQTETVEVGEPAVVRLDAKNIIDEQKEFVFTVSPGDGHDPVTSEGVKIPPGESATSRTALSYREEGTYTIRVKDTVLGEVTVTPCEISEDQSFPMTGYDAGNRGYSSEARGPSATADGRHPVVRWQHQFADDGTAWGVIVGDGKLFTTTESAIVALNPCTGEQLWRTEYQGDWSGTPAYMDGLVYFTARNGSIYAFDSETGDIVSQNGGNEHATSTAAVDGFVYVYNEHENLTRTPETITAYDDELNKEWSASVREGYMAGRPAISGSYIAMGAGKGLGVYDRTDGSNVWEADRTYSNESVAIHNGTVWSVGWDGYRGGPTIAAHDLESGRRVAGTNDSPSLYTVPIIANGSLFAGSEDGVYEFDLSSLTLNKAYKTNDTVDTEFGVTSDRIYVADETGLVSCFDRNSGVREWAYQSDAGEAWQTRAVDDVLYVTTSGRGLIALG